MLSISLKLKLKLSGNCVHITDILEVGTNKKYPDYQGVLVFQVSLYDKAPFGTIVDYAGVLIFKCPD